MPSVGEQSGAMPSRMRSTLPKAWLHLMEPYECPSPPNGGVRGWLVVFASFTIFVVSVGYQYTTGVFFKAWVQSAEFSTTAPATLAWANSIDSAGVLCGSVFAGWIIVRTSPRVCTVVGAALTCTGAVIAATFSASTPFGLFCLYLGFGLCMGFGSSFSLISAVCAVQQYFTTRRGSATGLTVAGSGVGAFILGPLLETLNDSVGWRVSLAGYGIAASAICVFSAFALIPIALFPDKEQAAKVVDLETTILAGTAIQRDAKTHSFTVAAEIDTRELVPDASSTAASLESIETTPRECSAQARTASSGAKSDATIMDLLKSPGYTTFCLAAIANCLMWFMIPTFMPVFIIEDVGGSTEHVKGVVATHGAANMLGRLILGFVVDAMPQFKIHLLVMCLGFAAVATLGLAATNDLVYAYVAEAIIGGFGGSVASLQPAIIIDLVGLPALPLGMGVMNTLQTPAALFGAPLGGLVRQAWGSYQGTWLVAGVAHSVATILAVGVPLGWVDLRYLRRYILRYEPES